MVLAKIQPKDVVLLAVVLAALAPANGLAGAGKSNQCTTDGFCYCVDDALMPVIDQRVDMIRRLVADHKQQGKAIGYLSIPLSSVAGSYFNLNIKVAKATKDKIEARLGSQDAWVLNPGASDLVTNPGEQLLPRGTGADYMLMWTKVLEGTDGLGTVDFVYFVGPADFEREFDPHGTGDTNIISKVGAYYDDHAKTDGSLRAIDRKAFRDYYGLRASVAYSLGSHDEWNIIRAINERRRAADATSGIVSQIAVFFNGQPVAPGLLQAAVEPGDAGACRD